MVAYFIDRNHLVEIMKKVISHWDMLDLCFSCFDVSKCFLRKAAAELRKQIVCVSVTTLFMLFQ